MRAPAAADLDLNRDIALFARCSFVNQGGRCELTAIVITRTAQLVEIHRQRQLQDLMIGKQAGFIGDADRRRNDQADPEQTDA